MEGTSEGICYRAGPAYIRLLKFLRSRILIICKNWNFTSSLGNSLQCLANLMSFFATRACDWPTCISVHQVFFSKEAGKQIELYVFSEGNQFILNRSSFDFWICFCSVNELKIIANVLIPMWSTRAPLDCTTA